MDIVLGAQYGDEGKGKLTDHLLATNKFDVCARYVHFGPVFTLFGNL